MNDDEMSLKSLPFGIRIPMTVVMMVFLYSIIVIIALLLCLFSFRPVPVIMMKLAKEKRALVAYRSVRTLKYDPGDNDSAYALRWLRIKEGKRRITFVSVASEHQFHAGDCKAVCSRKKFHEAPDPDCSCGLYSLHSFDELAEAVEYNEGLYLAEVRVWGRVIEAEKGNRSAYQSVLRVIAPPECAKWYCRRKASGLIVGGKGFLLSTCAEHSGSAKSYTLQQLRDTLQTEFEWATPV